MKPPTILYQYVSFHKNTFALISHEMHLWRGSVVLGVWQWIVCVLLGVASLPSMVQLHLCGALGSFMFFKLFLNGVILLAECCCLKASTNQDDLKQLILTKTACCVASRCVFWLRQIEHTAKIKKNSILVACTFCSAWDVIILHS